jgi:hypothetical protein
MTDFDTAITKWAETSNAFFEGPSSDWLSLLPYAVLMAVLVWVSREKPQPAASK